MNMYLGMGLVTLFLVMSQIFLKRLLNENGISIENIKDLFNFNVIKYLLFCSFSFIAASALWLYLLKKNDFSKLYPLVALSYVWAVPAAYLFLEESVTASKIFGVLVISAGVYYVSR